jgi:EAL domain-containing protein (putative c-di-GMP-specific phosphodiesterase class I)
MRRAIEDIAGWDEVPARFKCFINLSGHQLGDLEFVTELRKVLTLFPAAREHLGIEITETVAMQDAGRTLISLAKLRELGAVIALDDFGTGYSSLSYLKRFPIDVIKIDRSFVAGLPGDPQDVALVTTLIAVAQQFGFRTLAEGIEASAQADWLRERGCAYGQGFAIARPMLFSELKWWVEERATASI